MTSEKAPERIWIAGRLKEYGSYYPEAVEAEGEHGGFAVEYVPRAALAEAERKVWNAAIESATFVGGEVTRDSRKVRDAIAALKKEPKP